MPQQNNLQSTSQEQSSQKQQTNANNQQTQQRYDYDHNGVYRTPLEQKAHEQWIKDQVEWKKQNETRKQSYKMNISIFQIKCMKMELAKPNIILWKTSR